MFNFNIKSLPSRERGLKLGERNFEYREEVAPFAGAWIEILFEIESVNQKAVAPFAGAWIEISRGFPQSDPRCLSLPSRERGLKFIKKIFAMNKESVAPFAGAWIEILYPSVMHSKSGSLPSRERGLKSCIKLFPTQRHLRRSLRGSVD